MFPVVTKNVIYKCAGGNVIHHAGTEDITVLIE
jgi:hypothetical protein